MGISFLKHIERVRLILFIFDVSSHSILEEFNILKEELREYNERLLKKPYLIVLNKTDMIEDPEFLEEWVSLHHTKRKKCIFYFLHNPFWH